MAHFFSGKSFLAMCMPALVAQLDAHLTGDKEVAGSTPWVGNMLNILIH